MEGRIVAVESTNNNWKCEERHFLGKRGHVETSQSDLNLFLNFL